MVKLSGQCSCGKIKVTISLSKSTESYTQRACDCDFCIQHHGKYISDPLGQMQIVMHSKSDLKKQKQGSGTADFCLCSQCGSLIGVVYQNENKLCGAVNSNILMNNKNLGPTITVSPKKLDVNSKITRWNEVWFQDVQFIEAQKI